MITTVLGRQEFRAVPEQVGEARRWLRTLLGDGDAGAPTRPRVLSPDGATPYGRGLLLVDALSGGRWGWADGPAGATVWFEVPRW